MLIVQSCQYCKQNHIFICSFIEIDTLPFYSRKLLLNEKKLCCFWINLIRKCWWWISGIHTCHLRIQTEFAIIVASEPDTITFSQTTASNLQIEISKWLRYRLLLTSHVRQFLPKFWRKIIKLIMTQNSHFWNKKSGCRRQCQIE